METERRMSLPEARQQMAKALSFEHVKPEIRQIVIGLFSEKPLEFVRARLKNRRAVWANIDRDAIEPSNLFLELLATVIANDVDKIVAIDHGLRSPSRSLP